MYLSRSVHVPTIPTRPGRPKAGPGPSDDYDDGDGEDSDCEGDNKVSAQQKSKLFVGR